ncbi:hypothetical protein NE237_008011 [Protea cynaroides]|uniref:PWWP domain-containing protein n=1 Tax=Protea cynaroides TaxID=273540 RepID=A0A9Q0KQH7_9MAGN|nr:hypothetical protein NE237_008011 [Protea cynaroides]
MENLETLTEGKVLVESAKAQTLVEETIKVGSRVSNETLTGSQLPSDVPVDGVGVQVNGIRVSINTIESVDGDVTTRMGGVISGLNKEEVGTGMAVVVEDDGSLMTAASLELQENGKEFGFAHENAKEIGEGDVKITVARSGSAGDENKESTVAQILPITMVKEDGSSQLKGGDSVAKIEASGDGIPLIIEIHGSCEANEKSCGVKNNVFKPEGGWLSENGENPGDKFSGMPAAIVETRKINGVEGKEEKEEVDSGEEELEVNDQEHEFSTGDFVWGKIKSHPWWPGQIYDPSDASNYAAQCHRRNRLLVAYFGDGTFAWCRPSQLKPFKENFDLMSNQSNSKGFVNAVQEAVDEIGRRVELEMTCACVPEEIRNRLASRPMAVNAGIKEGISGPDGGIGELTITRYEPAKFLACLRDVAEVVSVNNILEHTVLRSCLSALYRAKGYRQLPMYHEAKEIACPEDSAVDEEMNKSILNDQLNLHSAEVEWLSSPVGPDVARASSQSQRGISDDKLYQKKKQKSMAELLAGIVYVEHMNESDAAGEVISGKPASTSKKKKKGSENDINIAEDSGGNDMGLRTKKLNKRKLSVSPPTEEKKSSGIDNDDGAAEAFVMSSSPRVRKKSKYLSPPYTDLSRGSKSLNSPQDSQTESSRAKKVSSIGECIPGDADQLDQLTGTPPIVRCSSQTSQRKPSKESGFHRKTYGNLSPRKPNSHDYKNFFMEANASVDEMFSDFLTIALDPFYLKGRQRFNTFRGFFSRFRSSVYLNKSNSERNSEEGAVQSSRKRKSLKSNPGSSGQDSHATGHPSSEPESNSKRNNEEGAVQGSRKRKSLKSNPGSSGQDSHATGHPSSEPKSTSKRNNEEVAVKGSRKRKSLKSNPGSSGQDSHATGHPSSVPKSKRKRVEMKEALPQDLKNKLPEVDATLCLKADHSREETKEESSAEAAVILTFASGFSLPSKDDLITIFGRFGALNEKEVEVLKDSNCARVAFMRSSDAEEAFNSSQKVSPFGHAVVNYRLGCSSAISGASEVNESSHLQPIPLAIEGNEPSASPSASRLPAGEAPPLVFIKQNLEMMTSMLEKSGDKLTPEVKTNLEGEIKGLLKKLSTMNESSLS